MMVQLIHELTETGKGMVLLSYLADLIYSDQSNEERYELDKNNILRRYTTTDLDTKIHNIKQVIKEYRKISNSTRYGEAKIRIENTIDNS